ncbi:hypothetical protein DFH08DRAFT_681651 [Mycena albidolilacea]|uniref:Uncharacterized protein n=1 Tax=Mycena albidolilacea TaxID=1033008 RepID=A0AAD7API2_9AGAR|nr:hypothetical protein DFH08DRAFT_681651 [Mycena albidolilacea]
MLQTARKFKLTFDTLTLSKDIKEELPIYFHMGGNRDMGQRNNSKCAKCLRDFHEVQATGDVLAIVERDYQGHSRRHNCACRTCREDRLRGCSAPYLCLEEAIKMLDCLYEKWDPRIEVNQRTPRLTEEWKQKNTNTIEADDPVLFDPSIHLENRVDGFRIFGEACKPTPAHQIEPLEEEEEETIYIGNSHRLDSDGDNLSVGSIWYNQDDKRNMPVTVPRELASPDAGAAAAIL